MNLVFLGLVLVSVAVAGANELFGGGTPMAALTAAMIEAAERSVMLAIGLIGILALFLGLMKVAEDAGLLTVIAKIIRPLMTRAFKDVPPDHPAMGAMVLNLSASALGLGNAATPFGIRAMEELDKLNPHKGTASDAQALFLALNTSCITLIPTSVIALRAAAGSRDPAGILGPTLFATVIAMVVAVIAVRALRPLFPLPAKAVPPTAPAAHDTTASYPLWVSIAALVGLLAFIVLAVAYGGAISPWIIPLLMAGMLAYGWAKRVPVYEVFAEGAREGFAVAVRIIPYLVAILVAIAMLRASGTLDAFVRAVTPLTAPLGLPAEAVPMAVLRPLTGSGAYAVLADLLKDPSIGPDSYIGYLASTIQGSTETTFYTIAVYFGAVGVKRVRHTLAAALLADIAAIAASVIACLYMFE
ncbi:MAG TPA: nucleoside recognition domain-containing protein [Alphaproteobacteria bacterium]